IKRDNRLCAFVIAWIFLPRGSNHAQLTTKDICLIHVQKQNIQTDWAAAILDNMIKVTRLDAASIPYAVFISKVLQHYNVDCAEETCESYGKRILVDKNALHHMGLRFDEDNWVFKDENLNEEEVVPIGSSLTATSLRPKIECEKFMVKQMHSLSTLYQSRFGKLDKDIVVIQQKLGIQSLDDDNEDEEMMMMKEKPWKMMLKKEMGMIKKKIVKRKKKVMTIYYLGT
ncbi:hypothetical protein LR48_Vigan08g041600, partial [Vigna angularis]